MKLFLRATGNSVKGALWFVVVALLVDGLAEQFVHIHESSRQVLTGCALLIPIIGVSLLGGWLIFRSDDERYLTRVALAIVGFSLLCRLVWIFTFDSYQVSDFGEYLNSATDLTDELWRRAAFYTYPLVLFLGKSLLAVKIVNVVLATLTAWIFFLAGRIILGTRVAAVALLFFIWHADLWYSITLASHDIPGLFWLSLFFYLAALLQRRLLAPARSWLSAGVLSLCLGGCIFFLGAVRSYHYGAMLALAICAAIHAVFILSCKVGERSYAVGTLERPFQSGASMGERFRLVALHTAFLLIIPVCVYRFAETEVWKPFKLEYVGIGPGLACYLTVTDVLGTSDYDGIHNWYEEQCPIIKADEQRTFAVRKLLHEVTHSPGAYLLHLERKNRILSRADAYLGWSTSGTYESWDTTHDQVKRINDLDFHAQRVAIALGSALLLLLVLWRVLHYPELPLRITEIIPILFSVIYYAMFLFLLESQSRYSIFLIFVLSWIAAQAVVDLVGRRAGKSLPALPGALPAPRQVYFGGMVVLILVVAAFWIGSNLIADSSLTLRDQTGFANAPPDELAPPVKGCPEVTPVFVSNNFKQLMVAYPSEAKIASGSVIGVQRTFVIKQRPQHHLRFFLSTYAVRHEPFQDNVNWEDTNIEYFVAVNGQVITSGQVNSIAGNKYLSFDSNDSSIFAPKMTIQLILRNVDKIEKVNPERGPLISLEYIDLQ